MGVDMDITQLRDSFAAAARQEADASMLSLVVGAVIGLVFSTVVIWIGIHFHALSK